MLTDKGKDVLISNLTHLINNIIFENDKHEKLEASVDFVCIVQDTIQFILSKSSYSNNLPRFNKIYLKQNNTILSVVALDCNSELQILDSGRILINGNVMLIIPVKGLLPSD